MAVHTDSAMRSLPGHVFLQMEVGGVFIDNDGMYGDIADARRDPDRTYFDPNDADAGYIGISLLDDAETNADRDNRIFGEDDSDPSVVECQTLHGQDELQRLIIEQELDDTDITVPVKAKPKKKVPGSVYYDQKYGLNQSDVPKKHDGRNNRYKDHRLGRQGKAAKMRAKAKRSILGQIL